MEENQNTTNQAEVQSSQTLTQPVQAQVPQQSEVQPNAQPQSGSKHTLMILILILAVVLMIFIYVVVLNRQQNTPSLPVPAIPTTAPAQMTDEEELNSIDAGDVDADLQEIETDLNSL